jgi:hypothetical protein
MKAWRMATAAQVRRIELVTSILFSMPQELAFSVGESQTSPFSCRGNIGRNRMVISRGVTRLRGLVLAGSSIALFPAGALHGQPQQVGRCAQQLDQIESQLTQADLSQRRKSRIKELIDGARWLEQTHDQENCMREAADLEELMRTHEDGGCFGVRPTPWWEEQPVQPIPPIVRWDRENLLLRGRYNGDQSDLWISVRFEGRDPVTESHTWNWVHTWHPGGTNLGASCFPLSDGRDECDFPVKLVFGKEPESPERVDIAYDCEIKILFFPPQDETGRRFFRTADPVSGSVVLGAGGPVNEFCLERSLIIDIRFFPAGPYDGARIGPVTCAFAVNPPLPLSPTEQ